jgi:anaerobic selenocysteine-containing dehydrogenase
MLPESPELRQVRTTCNRDCPDSCGIVATVDAKGRIVKHIGDPEHGVTRGFLCQRGNRYLRRFYSDARVLHPQRRTKSGWQRVSWDDALDLTAEQLTRIRDELGPTAVLACTYSGIKGLVARSIWKRFWAHFGGATFMEGGTSVEASHAAQHADFGGDGTHAPDDLQRSKAVVVWGKNIDVTRPHAMAFVSMARRAGAQLHVIDPVRCATARKAAQHYQLRPGSDAWLALGLGRLLVERSAYDAEFVQGCCSGFAAYAELVRSVSLEQVTAATDLPLEQLEQLADLYARTKPLATLIGLGPSYWPNAGEAVRLIDALAAITGNLGLPGGGAQTDTVAGYTGLDLKAGGEQAPRAQVRKVLLPMLGQELEDAADPPIRAAFVAGANPAATCPDTRRVQAVLGRLDFSVVVDQFMTATAEQADLLLPCATYLEMDDLVVAYGHHWLGVTQEVVPPLGEVRTDVAILQDLASRLGFGSALAGEPRNLANRILGRLAAAPHALSFEQLAQRPALNPLAAPIPFADHVFGTPSGKVELIGELERLGSTAVAESELHLVATKTLKMVNAQINEDDRPVGPSARVHPQTLAAHGIADGAEAHVVSSTRRVRVTLVADETVRRDVVLFNPAAWRGDLQGVNQLREAIRTDVGKAAAMHATRVRLEQVSSGEEGKERAP